MARDTEYNAYFTVGIPRDSQTYRQLLADANESNLSMAKLIALRVTDWYKLTLQQVVMVTGSGSGPHTPMEPKAEQAQEEASQARVNASAALDAWL